MACLYNHHSCGIRCSILYNPTTLTTRRLQMVLALIYAAMIVAAAFAL